MKGSRTRLNSLVPKICKLFKETEMTIQEITDAVNGGYHHTWNTIELFFTDEERKARKVRCYTNSKVGDKNPSFGKMGKDALHWKDGRALDGKGYVMVTKPDWYTTRKRSKYIFEHHYIYCIHNNLTSIPKGYCVHHKDRNPLNNNIENLELLSMGEHTKLHAKLRKVQRLSEAQKID